MRRIPLVALLLVLVAAGLFFRGTLLAHTRSVLLISDAFPAFPVKPLPVLTQPPAHERVQLDTPQGPAVADIFLPVPRFGATRPGSAPAVILAMGVRTQEKDKPIMFSFATTMARLGYVVMWPRLQALDRGVPLLEYPSTFLAGYQYLERMEAVDTAHISFIGFSVGSSIALVTATDRQIADRVRAVVFFGGYYDVFTYFTAIVTGTSECSGMTVKWTASIGAPDHIREIFEETNATHLLRIFDARSSSEVQAVLRSAPEREMAALHRANPAESIDELRARVFILHDKGDSYVPYCESVRLHEAMAPRQTEGLLLVDLFEHVQPGAALTRETVADFARLYWFLAATFEYL